MLNVPRRNFLLSGLALGALASPSLAHPVVLDEKYLPQLVNTRQPAWAEGTVQVVPDDFFLYFMLHEGLAIRYGVGVGRSGLYEAGTFNVARKAEWPWWRPTNAMIRRNPERYARFRNGVPGGPNNPLGARALYLHDESGQDTYLRIHGTNEPSTIGTAVSNGCARLVNEHVIDLYDRVAIGAKVVLHPKSNRA